MALKPAPGTCRLRGWMWPLTGTYFVREGDKKRLLFLLEIEPRFLISPVRAVVTVTTELFRLHCVWLST